MLFAFGRALDCWKELSTICKLEDFSMDSLLQVTDKDA